MDRAIQRAADMIADCEFADALPSGGFDLVYIDGSHYYMQQVYGRCE